MTEKVNAAGLLARLRRQEEPEEVATVAGASNAAPADEPVDAAGITEALSSIDDTSTPPPAPPPPALPEPVQPAYDGDVAPWPTVAGTSMFADPRGEDATGPLFPAPPGASAFRSLFAPPPTDEEFF